MTGLAKSSEIPKAVDITFEKSGISPINDIAPIELYDYFDIEYKNSDDQTKKQIKDIYKFLRKDNEDMSNVYSKLTDIAIKLGYPNFNETRHGKIWSYLKINSQIFDLQKRKELMERNV